MSKDTGGPAFPLPDCFMHTVDGRPDPMHGMTLRDYFAAKAMQAMLADVVGRDSEQARKDLRALGAAAYAIADSMLVAREVK